MPTIASISLYLVVVEPTSELHAWPGCLRDGSVRVGWHAPSPCRGHHHGVVELGGTQERGLGVEPGRRISRTTSIYYSAEKNVG